MATSSGSFALEILLVFLSTIYVVLCPFTKVEESFNLQATHDILYHGFDIKKYDHLEFPGVVPRSFIGPLFLSLLSYPCVTLLKIIEAPKIYSQYVVRLALGLSTVIAFILYKRAVSKKLGSKIGNFLVLLTMTQFHFLFYSSRPLPNTFALCLVLIATSHWLLKKHALFIWASAFVIIVFRTELCILLGLMLLIELGTRRLSLGKAFIHSALAGMVALGLTIGIDSVFWQRYLWPEGEVFYFNAVLNKSSQWGTEPFLWYFYSVLPRTLLFGLLVIPIGLWYERRTWSLAWPSFVFVVMFSFLPHKELRFIVYVLPIFNTVAACGLNYIYHHYHKWTSWFSGFIVLVTAAGLLCSCAATVLFTCVSHHNYQGGVAFTRLHQILKDKPGTVDVHITVAAAETGISRFGESNVPSIRYSKAEGLKKGSPEMQQFTHLITEAPCTGDVYDNTHIVLDEIKGFTRVVIDLKSWPFIIRIRKDTKLFGKKNRLFLIDGFPVYQSHVLPSCLTVITVKKKTSKKVEDVVKKNAIYTISIKTTKTPAKTRRRTS